ncbi:5-deoxy-glucuronate isomerase [Streptomyces sp. NPDC127105]|uniref:5-deoxy-glucuronate isomerase n=1 Tax=Streptomyces sp. NPDC127105 TaxID=3345359 RepID=UPI003662FF43
MKPTTVRTPNGLDVTYHQIPPGQSLQLDARTGQETALVLLSGQLTMSLPLRDSTAARTDPFSAPAAGWHLPPATPAIATAGPRGAEAVEVHSPVPEACSGNATDIAFPGWETRGSGAFERQVTTLLQPPQTTGLLLGETIARDGRWSTYPPHRHEQSNPPHETALEEAFAFRVRPSSGFGVLITYSDSVRDARSTIQADTSLAAVPHGYHTIAAAAGHDLYYLWAAHGITDTHLAMHTDPVHAWLLSPNPTT